MKILESSRGRVLVSILVLIPVGFGSKLYAGPGAFWVNNSLSGVLYVIFWCLLAVLLVPRGRPWVICLAVLVVTCLLEVMQLWDPPLLALTRSTFIGKALLGTTFVWSDFVYYIVGAGLGYGWIQMTRRR